MLLLKHIKARLIKLRNDVSGGVTMSFSLVAIPMLFCVGAAVDYTRAANTRANLQHATDATILAVSRSAQDPTVTPASLAVMANTFFQSAVHDTHASIIGTPTISAGRMSVCIQTASLTPTTLTRLMGISSINVGARACTQMSNDTYEIAMVLDNSGSMNESSGTQAKIDALKVAATNLVDIMNPSGVTPRAQISIAPFSTGVNVGPQYQNATWLDQNGQSSLHWQNFLRPANAPWLPKSRFDMFTQMQVNWGGCVEERPVPYTTTDTPADVTKPDTLFVPYLWPDEPDDNSYYSGWHQNKDGSWSQYINKYLVDTGGSCKPGDVYDVADNTSGRGDGQTKLCKYKGQKPINGSPGPNYYCTSRALQTMLGDPVALKNYINTLYASGNTNLTAGFMWGWRTISPNGPFGNAKPYGAPNNVKVIILMTDGFNAWNSANNLNKSYYSMFGYYVDNRVGTVNSGNARTLLDQTTLSACANAKAAGITVYTVGFNVAIDPIDAQGLNLLQICASNPSMAYVANDGAQIIQAFKDIANSIGQLRLTN